MNLWAKGIWLFFLSALTIFSSCKDELNKIGNDIDKDEFQVLYKEFILPSTTVLFDSVRTDNTPRFLIGNYTDEIFGDIQSTPFMAFHTTYSRVDLVSAVKDSAIVGVYIDSVVFNTSLDYYHYGEKRDVEERFPVSIHKVNNNFVSDDYHFNSSEFDFDPTPLASFEIVYNTDSLDNADSVIVHNFSAKLPWPYQQELMTILKANTFEHPFEKAYNKLKELVPVDSTNVSSISDYLYGFALKSDVAAKDVLGLSNSRSNVAIHYHTSLDTSIFYMGFNLNSNFNNISVDRASSTTSEIVGKEIAYELGGTRHVQAGTGVMTQVSLNEVLSFMNTQENMIVSSSELEFENVKTNILFPPPVHFNLLHSTNKYRRGTIFFNGENINLMYDDNKQVYSFLFDEEESNYKGLPRKYIQELYDHNKVEEINNPENVISEAYLMVQPANNGFSLNRFSLNNEGIKLKLYYSLPK